MSISLHDEYVSLTTRPTTADQVSDWDGAWFTKKVSMALFDAVAAGNLEHVKRLIKRGAKVNISRRVENLPDDEKDLGISRTPLDLSLWLQTHTATGEPSSPSPENDEVRSRIAIALMDAGALSFADAGLYFSAPGWHHHPVAVRFDHERLDRIIQGEGLFFETKTIRADHEAKGFDRWTPDGQPYSWLHRAIQRRRWDVVKKWVDLDLALNRGRTVSACEAMAQAFVEDLGERPNVNVTAYFAPLRPGVLRESDTAYRREVLGLLRTVVTLSHGSPATLLLEGWLDRLLLDRPLNDLRLTSQEIEQTPKETVQALAQRLQRMETDTLLATSLASAPPQEIAEPVRRRL